MGKKNAAQVAGEALRICIKSHGMTQGDFAYEVANADIKTINNYINKGLRDIDRIQEYAAYFGLSFGEFMKLGDSEFK